MKIYLSPSNQPLNRYAYGNTNEKVQMERLCDLMAAKLKKYECTVRVATKSLHYSKRDEEAKAWGANLYMAEHTNAGPSTARGAVVFSVPATNLLAEQLIKELNAICPYPENRADQTKDGIVAGFGEIWGPKAKGIPTILIENDFHTNRAVAKWMIENMDKIADATVQGIVRVYKLKAKTVAPPKQTDPKAQTKTFKVEIVTAVLNYRTGPGISYDKVGYVKKGEVYTITDVKNGWGKLKSGAGWINIGTKYVKRKA